jgi:hypothetical protein
MNCHAVETDSFQKRLFDGISRRDGTSAFLAPVDQCRCVLGREALIKAQAQRGYTLGWLCSSWDGDDGNCTDLPKCLAVRTMQRIKYHEAFGLWALSRLAFSGTSNRLCASCHEHREKSCIAGRKKIWEDLPSFFDLPPWGELKNDL